MARDASAGKGGVLWARRARERIRPVLSDPPGLTGAHLDRLVPLVEEFCSLDDDELRESCLQAFEAFLRK